MEDRYKMALEAIATMYLPVTDSYRVDALMKKIAQEALTPTKAIDNA